MNRNYTKWIVSISDFILMKLTKDKYLNIKFSNADENVVKVASVCYLLALAAEQ